MSYRAQVESVIAELRANPRVVVLDAQIAKPCEPRVLESVARRLREERGIVVPQGMLDLYAEMNGFTLAWEPVRSMRVVNPLLIVTAPDGLPWSYPPCHTQWLSAESLVAGDHNVELFWSLEGSVRAAVPFLIDHDQEEQGSWLVCEDNETRLYYVHSQGEDVDRLALDFEAFFAKFIAVRGFFCWQETLTVEVPRSTAWMNALFPTDNA